MLEIKKIRERQYLVSLPDNTVELDRNNFYLIKKRLSSYVKPQREITLDIGGVKLISNGGYKVLQELLNMAYTKRCKIKFINAKLSLPNKILKLSDKTFKPRKKLVVHT